MSEWLWCEGHAVKFRSGSGCARCRLDAVRARGGAHIELPTSGLTRWVRQDRFEGVVGRRSTRGGTHPGAAHRWVG